MYNVASSTNSLILAFGGTGLLLGLVVSLSLAGLVALFGLGFGVRSVSRYIFGNAPGTFGYDSSMGSGASYYHPRKSTRNASGGANLLG